MAKFKGKGVVVAGLIAGAASFLSKKENRDKAMEYFNQAKQKVNESGGVQGLMDKVTSTAPTSPENSSQHENEPTVVEETLQDVASAAGDASTTIIDGNQMLDEGGGQTTIDAYNEHQEKHN